MIPNDFITRWQASGAAERANYQLFLSELCDLLEVDRPNPKIPIESNNGLCLREVDSAANWYERYLPLIERCKEVVR